MNILKSKCASCSLNGYSPEICKFHLQRRKKKVAKNAPKKATWKSWGNTALLGAGVSIAGAVAGMAVVPAFGIKALLGHAIAAKIAGGAGVVGAGSNLAVEQRKKAVTKNQYGNGRKKSPLLPRSIGKIDKIEG